MATITDIMEQAVKCQSAKEVYEQELAHLKALVEAHAPIRRAAPEGYTPREAVPAPTQPPAKRDRSNRGPRPPPPKNPNYAPSPDTATGKALAFLKARPGKLFQVGVIADAIDCEEMSIRSGLYQLFSYGAINKTEVPSTIRGAGRRPHMEWSWPPAGALVAADAKLTARIEALNPDAMHGADGQGGTDYPVTDDEAREAAQTAKEES